MTTPVVNVIVKLADGTAVCDFCNSPSVAWLYPAADVPSEMAPWTSHGGWTACCACHDLVEAEDWAALTRKSVDSLIGDSDGEVRALPAAVVYGAVADLHDRFRVSRIGAAVPYDASPSAARR